jgi:hypothetical protein
MLRTATLAVIAVTSVAHAGPPPLSLDDGVFASSLRFPAESKDGKQLAQIFRDGEDFSGAPITTLVIWSTASGAVIASFSLGGTANASADPKAVLARANARLATTTWHDAPIYVSTDATSVTAAGTTFTFDTTHETIEYGKRRVPVVSNRIVAVDHGCGSIPRGFELAFGAGKLVVLVLAPGSLGGDRCAALPSVDTAIALVLP